MSTNLSTILSLVAALPAAIAIASETAAASNPDKVVYDCVYRGGAEIRIGGQLLSTGEEGWIRKKVAFHQDDSSTLTVGNGLARIVPVASKQFRIDLGKSEFRAEVNVDWEKPPANYNESGVLFSTGSPMWERTDAMTVALTPETVMLESKRRGPELYTWPAGQDWIQGSVIIAKKSWNDVGDPLTRAEISVYFRDKSVTCAFWTK